MNTETKNVWILNEGSQGHVVQSRGLVRELAKQVCIRHLEIPVLCSLPRRFDRSLAKRLLRLCGQPWMFRALYPKANLPSEKPDLILSSGPRSLAALEFLSKHYQCPSVFVQGTIEVPPGSVTCIVRPFEGKQRDDYVFIPMLFNEITPDVVSEAKSKYLATRSGQPRGPLNALFIGESTKKIRFEQSDWAGLVAYINAAWKIDGIQWLVSTSYRTSGGLEEFLRKNILAEAIFDAVWYSKAPRSITKEFLGMAENVFITMDSLTMMTEAVSSGAQVHLVCPERQTLKPENSHHFYIEGLHKAGLLNLFRPGSERSNPASSTLTAMPDYSDAIRQILAMIGWAR